MQNFYKVGEKGAEHFQVCDNCVTNYKGDYEIEPISVHFDSGGEYVNKPTKDNLNFLGIVCKECGAVFGDEPA